jgi:hypothetical protein
MVLDANRLDPGRCSWACKVQIDYFPVDVHGTASIYLDAPIVVHEGSLSAVLEWPLTKPALTMLRTAALRKMGREEARGSAGPMNASKAQIGCEPSRPQVSCRSSI